MFVGMIVIIAVQHDLAAEIGDRLHLDLGRGQRHDDDRRDSARARAASATPCAWLPAEAQMTPRCALMADNCAILLYAPRILNENTGCRSSRLNKTRLFRRRDSRGAASSGVSTATS